jgi:kumamolisin
MRRAAISIAAVLCALACAPVAGAAPLQLVFPLEVRTTALERFAQAVTTPGSPLYAQYQSIPWLARHFGASPSTRAGVVRYLRSVGARDVTVDATGLFVDASVDSALATRLFATPLGQFRTARGARYLAPRQQVVLPAGLRGLVTGVVGLDTRPLAPAATATSAAAEARLIRLGVHPAVATGSAYLQRTGTAAGCPQGQASGGFTPNQYLTAYGYDSLRAAGAAGQGERVALIEIDGFKPSDIDTFAQCFGLSVPAIDAFGVGVNHDLQPGEESTLDLEVLDASAPLLKAIDVYEVHPDAADTLRALTAPLQNPGHKPQVISASLGLCEQQLVGAVGVTGLLATESSLEMAAASGISLLASSGDQGSSDCTDPTGSPLPELAVNYPASSPWVTAVGGTNFMLSAGNQIQSEVVWNDAPAQPSGGGGGFSRAFRRPSYQTGTVSQNARAVPDVSMLADVAPGYAVYCTTVDCAAADPNPWTTVGGTSAGTPLLAGGLAIIDQELLVRGRQGLGLVNPLLYAVGRSSAAGAVFNDVTVGSNDLGPLISASGAPLGCCSAKPGFDVASGWGSVKVGALSLLALATQPPIVGVSLSLPGHQRPVASGRILATVACTGRCLMASSAGVAIGRSKPFTVSSAEYLLSSRGHRTIALKFSPGQIARLRAGLAHGQKIVATVYGVIVDPGHVIERQTPPKTLRIVS